MPGGIKYAAFKVKTAKKKVDAKGKVRVGVIVGPKNCDPILPGTADKDYPEALKVKNNFGKNASGWGGQYQVDTQLGLKLQRTYPNVFAVDIIPGCEVTLARLSKNHINFNLGYDMVNANMSRDLKHEAEVKRALKLPEGRVFPEWDLQDFIYCKERYLQACKAAGISIADTIFVSNGIKPAELIKSVKAKGWDKFFIKPAHLCSFGVGGGKFVTKDCLADHSILKKYQTEEAKGYKHFLVQPYMLKPNGEVFDEVRNWFIDGKWSYSIFTHGTDDDAVFALKPGGKMAHLIEPCRKLAEKVYKEVEKVAKWRGKNVLTDMTRIDIGVIPVGNSGTKVKTFVNEIETAAATWLVRYCTFDIVKHMVKVYPKKINEFVLGLKPGEKKPDAEAMEKLAAIVRKNDEEFATQTGKRKRESTTDEATTSKQARRHSLAGA